ncbi:MAG: hypothetical protein GTN76_09665, partial [Candidatus Aenigmarchaeota archaeon]|nr:hypothetical protein [Candidatus Aenigmarchaeota archaeon]
MQKIILYILIIAMFIPRAVAVPAAQIKGVYFHDAVTIGDEVLKIRGTGILKWLFFN